MITSTEVLIALERLADIMTKPLPVPLGVLIALIAALWIWRRRSDL